MEAAATKARPEGDAAGLYNSHMSEDAAAEFYCPTCALPVKDPLVCGDCHAVICRICGTPLERIDDLGIG